MSLFLLSLWSVNFVVNHFIRTSEGRTAEANSLTLNIRSAYAVENELNNICSNCFEFLDSLSAIAEKGNRDLFVRKQNYFFRRNKNIAGIILADEKRINLKVLGSSYFDENKIGKDKVDSFVKENLESVRESCSGKVQVLNGSKVFGIPVSAVFVPWCENPSQTCIIFFSTEKISTLVSLEVLSVNETYVVNHKGDLIIHPETSLVLEGLNLSETPVSKAMFSGKEDNRQMEYVDSENRKHLGAYKKLDTFNLYVVTTAKNDLIYEALDKTLRNNMYLTVSILGLTVLIVLLYTHFGISKPLKILKRAVEGINRGDFNNKFIDFLNVKRSDEIGVLNSGITDEKEFLNTFSKFMNQNAALAIATKSIDFEPHPKDITIFFSDIRGFTAISDEFKNRYGNDSAAKIIGFLNDYMSRMVDYLKQWCH